MARQAVTRTAVYLFYNGNTRCGLRLDTSFIGTAVRKARIAVTADDSPETIADSYLNGTLKTYEPSFRPAKPSLVGEFGGLRHLHKLIPATSCTGLDVPLTPLGPSLRKAVFQRKRSRNFPPRKTPLTVTRYLNILEAGRADTRQTRPWKSPGGRGGPADTHLRPASHRLRNRVRKHEFSKHIRYNLSFPIPHPLAQYKTTRKLQRRHPPAGGGRRRRRPSAPCRATSADPSLR
ncbi:hypothetical protein EVAR_69465_1 [Eumeta japonica]|uniref:Uncharacterized protein n=1 Tax=Eumeta variegata TaxID=151549 RepID=A0A4C2AA82_EUMVA|nr:hypothetical protein EVAR_69465_1 [Eumeta japonica]